MKKLYSLSLFLLSGFSLFAQTYTDGVFVLNEGGAGSGGASVSFINNSNILHNDIFGEENSGAALGDTGQSMSFYGDNAYIVLNISNTIKIVNRNTFALVATISTGLNNPRYIAFAHGKAYVTCWGSGMSVSDDYLAVINVETNALEAPIPMTEGVERIELINNKLYVAHQGGYGYGNTISIIDPVTNTLDGTISVGDVPNSMLVKNGILYVLCGGKPVWSGGETYGKLVKVDLADNSVISTLDFPFEHTWNLEAGNDGKLYYTVDEDVFEISTTATTVPTEPLFSLGDQGAYGIYGMDVINDKIYVADAGDYVNPGHVYIYTFEGTLLHDYMVGVIPNSFYKALDALGTVDTNLSQFTVYPNPASGVFYINSDQAATIKMYDMAGRMVKNETYSVSGISVSDLTQGTYLAEITIGDLSQVKRIIVK